MGGEGEKQTQNPQHTAHIHHHASRTSNIIAEEYENAATTRDRIDQTFSH
jgi:hypothetical protein